MTPRSDPKRVVHNRWVRTTTDEPPLTRSSSGPNVRPAMARTPRTSKYSPVTASANASCDSLPPRSRTGRNVNAAAPESVSVRARKSRKLSVDNGE
jgi:hypothetical protein